MKPSAARQRGFTLIEISVVVIILAIISAISLLAINQAFDRRYSSEAENVLAWLNQLSQQATLEGVAYGVVDSGMVDSGAESSSNSPQLQAAAYYRQHWFVVSYPEPLFLQDDAKAEWVIEKSSDIDDSDEFTDLEEDALVPVVAMMPDGFMDPNGQMTLTFSSSPIRFQYRWDDKTATIVMQRVAP